MQSDLEPGKWKCGNCTFINTIGRVAGGGDTCEVCNSSISEGTVFEVGKTSGSVKPSQDKDRKPQKATEWVRLQFSAIPSHLAI